MEACDNDGGGVREACGNGSGGGEYAYYVSSRGKGAVIPLDWISGDDGDTSCYDSSDVGEVANGAPGLLWGKQYQGLP